MEQKQHEKLLKEAVELARQEERDKATTMMEKTNNTAQQRVEQAELAASEEITKLQADHLQARDKERDESRSALDRAQSELSTLRAMKEGHLDNSQQQGAADKSTHSPASNGSLYSPGNASSNDNDMKAFAAGVQRNLEVTSQLMSRLVLDPQQQLLSGQPPHYSSNGMSKGPHIKLPTFNGEPDSSFESWEQSLDEGLNHLGWGETSLQRVTILPNLLTSMAKIYYRSLHSHIKDNFKETMAALQKKFGLTSKSAIHVYTRLERSQGANESVADYSSDILRRIQETDIRDDRYILSVYLKGLKPEIKAELI
jgi:hypothetical protein